MFCLVNNCAAGHLTEREILGRNAPDSIDRDRGRVEAGRPELRQTLGCGRFFGTQGSIAQTRDFARLGLLGCRVVLRHRISGQQELADRYRDCDQGTAPANRTGGAVGQAPCLEVTQKA